MAQVDFREELVEIYPRLLRFAVSRTRDKDLGEDLVLEACKRLLEREHKLDPDTNITAYAITIIKNLVNDHGRYTKRFPDVEAPEVEDPSQSGSVFEITQAIKSLDENCQSILEWFGLGFSYDEISAGLKIPVGTVMSRMSRCRTKFKSVLEG